MNVIYMPWAGKSSLLFSFPTPSIFFALHRFHPRDLIETKVVKNGDPWPVNDRVRARFGVIRPPFVIILLFYTIWFIRARSILHLFLYLLLLFDETRSSIFLQNARHVFPFLISQYNWKDVKSRNVFLFIFWKRNIRNFSNRISMIIFYVEKFVRNTIFYYRFIRLSRKISSLNVYFQNSKAFSRTLCLNLIFRFIGGF